MAINDATPHYYQKEAADGQSALTYGLGLPEYLRKNWPLRDEFGETTTKQRRAIHAAADEIERLKIGHDRYETARRMTPRQWSDAYQLCINTGKPFDEIIDHMRPFMRPNRQR
jgi:hypothetical protein